MKAVWAMFLLGFCSIVFAKQDCDASRVKLQMLGTGGPELYSDDKASTGYLLWLDNKASIIIDAGPGTLQRFKQSGAQFSDVKVFLFSHFHVDHSADFIAYIKGGFFTDRQADLFVYGPSGDTFVVSAEQFVERLLSLEQGLYPYLSPFIDKEQGNSYFKIKTKTIAWSYKERDVKLIYQDENFTIKTVSVHHGPFPALAYRIETAGCVLSFSGDMSGRLHTLMDLIQDSDLFVAHNAITEDATGVPQLLHMKPRYIGKVAHQAKVKKLLLTHLMEQSLKRKADTLKLIKENYQGDIIFANDLDIFYP